MITNPKYFICPKCSGNKSAQSKQRQDCRTSEKSSPEKRAEADDRTSKESLRASLHLPTSQNWLRKSLMAPQ
jgi:hypothetical protein